MKVRDTYHGIKGEALRLMFNTRKMAFFDHYATMDLDKPASVEDWIAAHPEAHFYEYHVTGYMTSLLYYAGMHDYIPKDPQEYYDCASFARVIDKFQDELLMFLLKKDRPEAAILSKFEEIVEKAEKLLKNKKNNLLVGAQYSFADFAFLGLFLAYQDQPVAKALNKILKKYKIVKEYAYYHRIQFLPYLIEGGRFITCYANPPYSSLYRLLYGYKKVKTHVVQSETPYFTIAGLKYKDFTSTLEMLARTLGLLNNDHIFENLYYRDIAHNLLFAEKKGITDAIGEALYNLNNYFGYLRGLHPDKRWPATLADIYTALAVESCLVNKEITEIVKAKFPDAYAFSSDFLMRYRRAKHCVILKSSPTQGSPLPPESVQIINFMNRCRLDLHQVMLNLGFDSAETIYPLLNNYEKVLGEILERPEYKAGNIEIFAYIDANQKTDFMLGWSGIKFLEDHKADFAGCSYDFAWYTVDKAPMKKYFVDAKVPTAPYVYLEKWDAEAVEKSGLQYPALIKLSDAYASFGLTKDSKCWNIKELEVACKRRFEMYYNHPLLIESFIEGPEFTVLIAGIYDKDVHVYPPIARVFDEKVPEGDRWLFFELYWRSPIQKLFFKLVQDQKLAEELKEIAKKAYASVKGCGYGRVDIRQDKRTGKIMVLEVNCMCAVGFESSSYYALRESSMRTEDLFEDIFYYGKLRKALQQ